MTLSLIILISSFLISYKSIPLVKNLGERLSILDLPNERKEHDTPLVRLGGISIFIGLWIPILIIYYLDLLPIDQSFKYDIFFKASFLFFTLGILEDIFHLSFFIKLILQVIISLFIYSNGLHLNLIDLSFLNLNSTHLNSVFICVVTIAWIVGIVNAFNWIDGLDGLASGLTIIISLGFLILGLSSDLNVFIILVLCGIVGSNFGFLLHNFNPAKIFMGDGGSFFIGSLIALLSINPQLFPVDITFNYINNLGKVFLIGLPLLDMTYVIFKRISEKKSPFYPDRNHIHHRLIDFGFNYKQTILFCFVLQLGLALIGLLILKFR
tara:strand:- start:165 stop:1136 length:972 start_codon:yes stop_codon:yes gene_type:complete